MCLSLCTCLKMSPPSATAPAKAPPPPPPPPPKEEKDAPVEEKEEEEEKFYDFFGYPIKIHKLPNLPSLPGWLRMIVDYRFPSSIDPYTGQLSTAPKLIILHFTKSNNNTRI